MKKLFLTGALALFGMMSVNAQKALSEGSWVVEANTGFGQFSPAQIGVALKSSNGNTAFRIGAEAGYFVIENLAIKAGLGYTSEGNSQNTFNYKLGLKYYVIGQIPLQVDFNGASSDGNSANAVGLQGGYAWFVAPNVSLEPGIRYDIGFKEGQKGVFSGNLGFAIHF